MVVVVVVMLVYGMQLHFDYVLASMRIHFGLFTSLFFGPESGSYAITVDERVMRTQRDCAFHFRLHD